MTYTPPFHLYGYPGAALGAEGYSLAQMSITAATLRVRSLDVSELEFSLRDNGSRPAIPDDGQWLTLTDDTGRVMMRGICKRSFAYPARVYTYLVQDAYKGLMETPLLGNDGRPFLLYVADDLGVRVRDLLVRAGNAGLPINAPAADAMPEFYLAPKMAFRGATFADALEAVLKWAPDAVTRMDHASNPPTLSFATRRDAQEIVIDLDATGYRATEVELVALPEARALGVSLAYARRDGDDLILSLEQTAGDAQAESRRKLSVFLSGVERSDALVSDALTTAQLAIIKINELIAVTGAAVDAAAATAGLSLTWANCLERDSNLLGAVTEQSGFVMTLGGSETYYDFTELWSSPGFPPDDTSSYSGQTPYLADAGGAVATGWYAIEDGAFTSAQLTTAGAIQDTRYIRGELLHVRSGSTGRNAGQQYLWNNASAQCTFLNGYTSNEYGPFTTQAEISRAALWYRLNIPVDAINMSPSAVAAAVKAAAAGTAASGFIERAEFVEAPPSLAQNYFSRQDWTPYKGKISFTPTAPVVPMPGDFVSVRGEGCPLEWATMKVPVAETEINLETIAATVTIGPSPRMDFASLVDRLRIPQEDNYEPG